MAGNKDFLRGPSARDRAKDAMFQGACGFGIGALLTLGTWFFLGLIWFITPVIAVIGAFRFLYGLLVYLIGWE
jgi:hypothetical protein